MEEEKYYKEGEGSRSGALMMQVNKYTFPALKHNGKYYSLSMDKIVMHSTYHIYAKKIGDLPMEEQEYCWKVARYNEYHALDVAELRAQIERWKVKAEAANNIIERLRNSVWTYIAFRFKI
jgi:hypothetical protein